MSTTTPRVTRARNPVEGTAGWVYMIDGTIASRSPTEFTYALLRRTRGGWALVGLSKSESHIRRLRQKVARTGATGLHATPIKDQ